MKGKWHLNKFKIIFIIMLSIPSFSYGIDIEFTIHPQGENFECSRKYSGKEMGKYISPDREPHFFQLLNKEMLYFVKSDFNADREFYPCFQTCNAIFKDKKSLCDFVEQMGCCPQYPWYSGADFAIYEAIIKYAVDTGDQCVYRALLLKDTKNSASELDGPLYSRLRKNLKAFLTAFSGLSIEQKKVVIRTQYDHNKPVELQLIDISSHEIKESRDLIYAAKDYNILLKP